MKYIKRIMAVLIILTEVFSLVGVSAYAALPSTPHIESGTAADGGNFFDFDASYLGEDVWRSLKTPTHWVVETDEVAYCLDHKSDSPYGEEYDTFDPLTVYSEETYIGILAIIENSYPYRTAGLSEQKVRYATANVRP